MNVRTGPKVTAVPVTMMRDNTSELLDKVLQGESFLIMRHGRILAELRPTSRVGQRVARGERAIKG